MSGITLTIIVIFASGCFSSTLVQAQRQELVFQNGNYIFGYEYNSERTEITIDATVKTSGWVGFGFSNRDGYGMPESDIIIAGADDADGRTYFGDFYATLNGFPSLDAEQNGELLEVRQSDCFTFVKFRRQLISPDRSGQDVDIDSSTFILWAYGTTDIVQYHNLNAGKVRQSESVPSKLPPYMLKKPKFGY